MRNARTAVTSLFAVLATLSLGVGPIWEQLERGRAIRDFPAPGRLVDFGGRQIQMDCRGVGTPTVVFESGLDISGSLSWTKVQDEVAQFTRACAYCRAGIIWSDDKDGPHDGAGVARDLHATLAAANEKGAFVLVGHSLGGLYNTIYTKLYGDEVVGLVYVDASHPDQQQRMEPVLGRRLGSSPMMAATRAALPLRWTGAERLAARLVLDDKMQPNRPSDAAKIMTVFASNAAAPALAHMDLQAR